MSAVQSKRTGMTGLPCLDALILHHFHSSHAPRKATEKSTPDTNHHSEPRPSGSGDQQPKPQPAYKTKLPSAP